MNGCNSSTTCTMINLYKLWRGGGDKGGRQLEGEGGDGVGEVKGSGRDRVRSGENRVGGDGSGGGGERDSVKVRDNLKKSKGNLRFN